MLHCMKRRTRVGRPRLPRNEKQSERIVVRVTLPEWRELANAAADEDTSPNALVHRLVVSWLKKRKSR